MTAVSQDLDQALRQLDGRSAAALERLVRDALTLAQPAKTTNATAADGRGWPAGYFEKTAGSFAGEPFDLPSDPPPALSPAVPASP